MRMFRSAARAAVVAAAGLPFAAAAEPLVTDRPDFVESAEVVGRGRFQIETSLLGERDAGDGTRTRALTTPTLLRIGVDEQVELRVETDGFAQRRVADSASGQTQHERGFSDLSLGAKWHVRDGDEDAGVASVAWLLHVDIDSGSVAWRGQGLRPSLRVVGEWELAHGWSIGAMPGVLLDRNAQGDRFASGMFALVLERQLGARSRAVAEVAFEQIASKHDGGNVVTFNTGVAWLLGDDMQLDLSASAGLSSEAPDLQAGIGLSIRF